MKNLQECLKVLDQKIENYEKERGEEISLSRDRTQLVKELWKRAKGRGVFLSEGVLLEGVFISIREEEEFFRVTPKGFFWKGVENGEKPFPIDEAVGLASKKNLFSALLSAFIEGKAEVILE